MGKTKSKSKGDVRNLYFSEAIQSAQQRFSDRSVYMLREHESRVSGIPLPNLVLMWLMDSNVWLLSRMSMTHGKEQSGKSAFLYWLMRLFVEHGGMGVIVSAENKDSASLMESIIGPYTDWVRFESALTLQEWQEHVTEAVRHYVDSFGNEGTFPLLIGVDSLGGGQDENVKEDIDKQGFANARGYPVDAASITKYLKARVGDLVGRPIGLHFVNHIKPRLDGYEDRGPSVTRASSRPMGAVHMRYQTSMDIWFNRGQDADNKRGFDVHMRTEKSSIGDAHRAIKVRLKWYPDPDHPGGQCTTWDWDKALVDLLMGFKNSKKSGEKDSAVFDVLEGLTQSGAFYSCKRLGLKGVRSQEIGEAINKDPKVLDECIQALGIHKHRIFPKPEAASQEVKAPKDKA